MAVHSIRITETLLCEILETIENRNRVSKNEPWTFSSFITAAVQEKLAHMLRSRISRKLNCTPTNPCPECINQDAISNGAMRSFLSHED